MRNADTDERLKKVLWARLPERRIRRLCASHLSRSVANIQLISLYLSG